MDAVITEPLKEYDTSLFIDGNQANTYLCTICQCICNDVVSVECGNGHIFCRACMQRFVEHSNQCPNCQRPITSIHDAKFVERLIQSLQVKCASRIVSYISPFTNKQSQCAWIGPLCELNAHYQTQCDFTIMRCNQCGLEDIFRKDAASHIADDCAFTMVECTLRKQGCTQKMLRSQLSDHLEKHCSFRSMHCPYTKHGCLFTKKHGKLPMKELQQHLTEQSYRILHLELQLHSLTKQMEQQQQVHSQQQLLVQHGGSNIHHDNNNRNNSTQQSMNLSSNGSHGSSLLFAYIGSEEGKFAARNCIFCVDVTKGVSSTLLDPLSIALISSHHGHDQCNAHAQPSPLPTMMSAHIVHSSDTLEYMPDAPHAMQTTAATAMKKAQSEQSLMVVHPTASAEQLQRCWDIRNYGTCVAYNASLHRSECTVLFRVGGWNANDEQETALSRVDGYVVERNQWLHNIPDLPACSSGCGCVYSPNYGLIVVGGESPSVTDVVYQLPIGVKQNAAPNGGGEDEHYSDLKHDIGDNDDDDKQIFADLHLHLNEGEQKHNAAPFVDYDLGALKWKSLASMKRARTNLALSSFTDAGKEYVFVCGGYNDGESLKWCELYDFQTDSWQDIPKSLYRHQSAGCCFWQNGNGHSQHSMIAIGGYPEAKVVEEYSFYKNKWYKLPSTQHNHQFLPAIWVHSDPKMNPNGCGILVCAGNRCNLKPLNDRTATGYVEFFDKRESMQKWHTLYSLRDLIYFGLHCKIDSKEDDGRRVRRIFR